MMQETFFMYLQFYIKNVTFFPIAHINRMACWLTDFLALGMIEMMP